jgi:hypothetical protein
MRCRRAVLSLGLPTHPREERPIATPHFQKVLVHSTHMPDLAEFLRRHGLHLQPVNDVREGPALVLTVTPHGAKAIRDG